MSTATPELARAERLGRSLRAALAEPVDLAVVLGSGLSAFADELEDARELPFDELDGFPASTVPGHGGRLVLGRRAGRRVLVQAGRVHLYEGWSPLDVTASVRAYAALGVRDLLLTNAAGGLVPSWAPGTLMRLTDHLNLQEATPLVRGEGGYATPYDAELGALVDGAAQAEGIALEHGVYAAFPGPAYETPTEVRMAARLGAHAVGMSTALEAVAGHAAGLRVAAISCITNHAAGIQETPLSHEEVVAAGRAASGRFVRLLIAIVRALS